MYNTVEHAPPIAVLNAGSAVSSLIAILSIILFQEVTKGDKVADDSSPPIFKDTNAQRAGM
jgi:hypothetical protein